VKNINKENEILNENRYQNNKTSKIKRLRIGIILAIITGAIFISCQGFIGISYNWYNAANQRAYMDYDQGLITYEQYNDIHDQNELDLYTNLWTISIFSTLAKVVLNIVFIFIIIALLSIVLDESFNRKTRRLSLGLAGVLLLFILYPIIIATGPIQYILPY
jgi:hypothetical protein